MKTAAEISEIAKKSLESRIIKETEFLLKSTEAIIYEAAAKGEKSVLKSVYKYCPESIQLLIAELTINGYTARLSPGGNIFIQWN